MNLLDALFAGAKALLTEVSAVGRAVVREVLKEIDQSAFGRAATRLVDGVVDRYFKQARDLADEERELAEKAQRDGRRTDADTDRLRKIEAERARLRVDLERSNAERAAQEFRSRSSETLVARLDDDELSSNVGILAAKQCSSCDGTMRIRQGAVVNDTGLRKLFWQCTEQNYPSCPTIKFDPEQVQASIVRPADPDLDRPKLERRATWNRPDVSAQTHARVRQHLGDEDKQLVCPFHLLPMKLLEKRLKGGLVLDSYEYVCLGVSSEGRACEHKVELQSMPQVAAMLRRTEGDGIIRS
jgi:hypothetical protein